MDFQDVPKTKIQQLKAARDHLIARNKLLTRYSEDWYSTRKQLQMVTEEGEIMVEIDRCEKLKSSFNKAFPSTNQKSQGWQCLVCKGWKKENFDDPSSWLNCCSRRICIDCRESQSKCKKCPLCKSKENFPLSDCDEVYFLQDKDEIWAQYRMGVLLQKNNHERSAKYFRKAAEKEHPIAIYHLGFAHYTGTNTSIPQSNQKAKEYFLKSAQLKYGQAQYNLGLLCLEEDDDDDQANNNGYSNNAISSQKYQRQKQRIKQQNQQEGFRWISLAAQGGNIDAMAMLASLYTNAFGREAPVKKNLFLAKYWASKGALLDDGSCQMILAQTMMVLASQTFDGSYNRVGYNPIPKVLFLLRKTVAEEDSSVQNVTNSNNALKIIQNIEQQVKFACACCKKHNTPLKQCGRCRGASYYCGQDCMKAHWKMGHKTDCLSTKQADQLQEFIKKATTHHKTDTVAGLVSLENLTITSPLLLTRELPIVTAEPTIESFTANNLN
jgi:hypothetical protein